MSRTALVLLASALACAGCSTLFPSAASDATASAPPAALHHVRFEITSDFGVDSDWVQPQLEAAADVLVRLMDQPDVVPPDLIPVTLEKNPDLQGVGGWASPTELGFVGDVWPRDPVRLWVVTHELVNLFAAHYGGHGGFPSDWWSNGRSPFPAYLAGLVLQQTDCAEAAAWLRESSASEPDHVMYWDLDARFGFGMFARALAMLRADDVDLGEMEPPWPAPDATRSAYTMAYLSLAAGENLADTIASYGIGHEPSDWQEVHPEIPFVEYTVSAAEVEGIEHTRETVFAPSAPEGARVLFRTGKWRAALAAARAAADRATAAQDLPPEAERLAMLVGSWDASSRATFKQPPRELSVTARVEADWTLDRRFVVARSHYTITDAATGEALPASDSVGWFTWSAAQGSYLYWTFYSDGRATTGTMDFDAERDTWTLVEREVDPRTGRSTTVGRGSMEYVSPDEKLVRWTSLDPAAGGFRSAGRSRRVRGP